LRPAATAGLKVTAQILMAGGQPYVKISPFQDSASVTINTDHLEACALLMPHARRMRACFQRPWRVRFSGHL
jgi:hypothetical protein